MPKKGNNILDSAAGRCDNDRFPEILLPEGEGLVTVLEAYLDDSRTHHGARLSGVAGYLLDPDHCRELNSEWREVLARYGVQFLHMSEFAHFRGEFKNWTEEKRRAFIAPLIEIIGRHTLCGTGGIVERAEFMNTAPDSLRTGTGLYMTCVAGALWGIEQWAERESYTGPIAYVFEDIPKYMGPTTTMFAAIASDKGLKRRYRYFSFGFRNKYTHALQAADFFAYECCKFFTDDLAPGGTPRVRETFTRLATNKSGDANTVYRYGGVRLRRLIKRTEVLGG